MSERIAGTPQRAKDTTDRLVGADGPYSSPATSAGSGRFYLMRSAFFLPAVLMACAPPPAEHARALTEEPADSALAAACEFSAGSSATGATARIAAGRYVLTLIASDGAAPSARAHGVLWLHPTSHTDRSPRTGRGPSSAGVGVQEYLFGATSLDFRRVGAPVTMEPGDTITPPPTSIDPIRPGVLVSQGNSGTVVLISTLSNMRDDRNWLDGGGVGLHVRHISETRFAGVWSGWGIVPSREGVFCAVRTSA